MSRDPKAERKELAARGLLPGWISETHVSGGRTVSGVAQSQAAAEQIAAVAHMERFRLPGRSPHSHATANPGPNRRVLPAEPRVRPFHTASDAPFLLEFCDIPPSMRLSTPDPAKIVRAAITETFELRVTLRGTTRARPLSTQEQEALLVLLARPQVLRGADTGHSRFNGKILVIDRCRTPPIEISYCWRLENGIASGISQDDLNLIGWFQDAIAYKPTPPPEPAPHSDATASHGPDQEATAQASLEARPLSETSAQEKQTEIGRDEVASVALPSVPFLLEYRNVPPCKRGQIPHPAQIVYAAISETFDLRVATRGTTRMRLLSTREQATLQSLLECSQVLKGATTGSPMDTGVIIVTDHRCIPHVETSYCWKVEKEVAYGISKDDLNLIAWFRDAIAHSQTPSPERLGLLQTPSSWPKPLPPLRGEIEQIDQSLRKETPYEGAYEGLYVRHQLIAKVCEKPGEEIAILHVMPEPKLIHYSVYSGCGHHEFVYQDGSVMHVTYQRRTPPSSEGLYTVRIVLLVPKLYP